MSWDISVQDFPPDAKSVEEIPDDFVPKSLGSRSAVIAKIREAVPIADFSDPSWGRIEGDDWSIEINIGTEEDCESFALHVRGGDTALGAVASILDHLRVRAFDCQTGDFFVPDSTGLDSFRKWRAYRDSVVPKP